VIFAVVLNPPMPPISRKAQLRGGQAAIGGFCDRIKGLGREMFRFGTRTTGRIGKCDIDGSGSFYIYIESKEI